MKNTLLPEDEIKRLDAIIDHITDVGVYQVAVVGGPNPYEQRSEWQNGWNAAVTEMLRRYAEASRSGLKPDPKDA